MISMLSYKVNVTVSIGWSQLTVGSWYHDVK